ncbi:MAG TPA: DUF3027 domain-containing protein [Streptosporangiaceae bacterium]
MSPTRSSAAPGRSRSAPVDAACAAAVDEARVAADELAAPGKAGAYLGRHAEGDRVVTHFFECLDSAYRGWRWSVTVARAARAKNVTVSEVALLPGDDALLAPQWVPWIERLRPGDLGPGDLLPTQADDLRLAPGFTEVTDAADRQQLWELGLGRRRVLSAAGRDDAAERWYEGPSGPSSPIAQAAPAQCATCGFFVPLAGSFRQLFGVCANEYAPDDGKVVSVDHGCGAHSEAAQASPIVEITPPIVDEWMYDTMRPAGADDEGTVGHS